MSHSGIHSRFDGADHKGVVLFVAAICLLDAVVRVRCRDIAPAVQRPG